MKKVEFVRVKSELCGYGLGKATKYFLMVWRRLSKREWKTGGALKVIFPLKQEEQGI